MAIYDKLSQNKDRYIYKTLDQRKHWTTMPLQDILVMRFSEVVKSILTTYTV